MKLYIFPQGMVALVLNTIDEIGKFNGKRAFAHLAGDDAAEKYDDICSYLYLLLGMQFEATFIHYTRHGHICFYS